MIGKFLDIATPHGAIDCYASHPDDVKTYPLVILFMDIWGLRDELFGLARRVSADGFYCLVPNLFYREGKFRVERRNPEGRMMSFNLLPDDTQREMRGRAERLSRQTLRADIASILDFCANEPVRQGPAGSIGFCMGGREAFLAAQEFPDRFRATASLHGSRLETESPDSPHALVHQMRGEVYCGFAEFDRGAPPELVERLERSLKKVTDLRVTIRTHPGTRHGYALPDRDVYDHSAAEEDWTEIFSMLRRQLGR
jgi:carboxymethylenebutenolidase